MHLLRSSGHSFIKSWPLQLQGSHSLVGLAGFDSLEGFFSDVQGFLKEDEGWVGLAGMPQP